MQGGRASMRDAQRERVLHWQPTGPNQLTHRDYVSKPALRHGSLNSLFQTTNPHGRCRGRCRGGAPHCGTRVPSSRTPRLVISQKGGLVFKAHRLVHHSTLGWRVMKKKKEWRAAHQPSHGLPSFFTMITLEPAGRARRHRVRQGS